MGITIIQWILNLAVLWMLFFIALQIESEQPDELSFFTLLLAMFFTGLFIMGIISSAIIWIFKGICYLYIHYSDWIADHSTDILLVSLLLLVSAGVIISKEEK